MFFGTSCFFDDPVDVGAWISGSSPFSKTSLNIWKFTVHVLLKPGLENFENYFTSMWDEYNCAKVWAFFGIAFLLDWNENWPFPVLWPVFHSKMGSIKDRNGMYLTEAEDIKKRWQEYTEELYKKDLLDPDNHNGVITNLEPDILECEVKWALGSTTMKKLVGVMEFQLSYFKSWKMMLWKSCTQYASKVGKLSSGHRAGKVSFHSSPKERQCQKYSSYCTIALISPAS